jgi:ABC-2 type transport system permease protein
MAQVVRAGLCSQDASMTARDWIVLGVWGAVAMAGASWALGRRA